MRARLRQLLVPEVVQTSPVDCGPAALKSVFDGHGLNLSYEWLRDACYTESDGTSVNRVEELASELGFEAPQVMVPPDHLWSDPKASLPAVALTTLPNGGTHFVVLWRRHGPWIQAMDPARGRRWLGRQRLSEELLIHTARFDAATFGEWARSERFLRPLMRRLRSLGLSGRNAQELADRAQRDSTWFGLAALDAAAGMASSLVRAAGVRRGGEASRVLQSLLGAACDAPGEWDKVIPSAFWTARPAPAGAGDDSVLMDGAILVTFRDLEQQLRGSRARGSPRSEVAAVEALAPRAEARPRPLRELLQLIRQDGALAAGTALAALLLAAPTVVLQGLILRGVLDLTRSADLVERRLGAGAALLLLLGIGALIEIPIASSVLRMGRHLEARLRVAFSTRLSSVADGFFRSRPKSDLADRSHSIVAVRELPGFLAALLRAALTLLLTLGAIAWLHPPSALLSAATALAAIALPLLFQPLLSERDLRVRTHFGAMTGFYLDAMRGLVAIRSYGAEDAIRQQHEDMLVEWTRASLASLKLGVLVTGATAAVCVGLSALVLYRFLLATGGTADALLFSYWVLSLPRLGQTLAELAIQYPSYRNTANRLFEPFQRPPEALPPASEERATGGEGAALLFKGVSLTLGGKDILRDIDLDVRPGSKVAVVGSSGAGKSSLVGLLLGWAPPSRGEICVDERPLDAAGVAALRKGTAWIDPAIQLWNRPLWENVLYGAEPESWAQLPEVLRRNAELHSVAARLPEGPDANLGESGSRLSGGEGQRVRVARAMLRPAARLVLLDEPFRGLEREQRRDFLDKALTWWSKATVIMVTHDIRETKVFDRVVVMEGGRIAELGSPAELLGRASRYRALMEQEDRVLRRLSAEDGWRRWSLRRGRVEEDEGAGT